MPGMLLFMGSPRVRHDWAIELKWMVKSKTVYAQGFFPVPLSLWWALANPHLHRRPSNTTSSFVQSALGYCSCPLGLSACKICLCPPRLKSLFLSVLWKAYNQNPAGPQGQIPLGVSVPLLDPPARKPDVGFRTVTLVQQLLWYYCSPVCGSPTQRVWDLILSWLQPSLCGFFFVFWFGASFSVGSSILLLFNS